MPLGRHTQTWKCVRYLFVRSSGPSQTHRGGRRNNDGVSSRWQLKQWQRLLLTPSLWFMFSALWTETGTKEGPSKCSHVSDVTPEATLRARHSMSVCKQCWASPESLLNWTHFTSTAACCLRSDMLQFIYIYIHIYIYEDMYKLICISVP